MDVAALERARSRIADAAEGTPQPAELAAALERSREQVEQLAVAAAELEAGIPVQVGDAVRDGLRTEVLPVGRHVAEIRGLLNQAIRRLERLEGEFLAERKARVDDLALLVELVSSGWRGVDVRLARIERAKDLMSIPASVQPNPEPPSLEVSSLELSGLGRQSDAIAERTGPGLQDGRAAAA